MIIRKGTERDIPAVSDFYDRTVKYLCEHINYPKWTYKQYPAEAFVRAMTEEGSQFLCMDSDGIAGAFVLNRDPQGAYENARWSRELSRGEYMVCHALASEIAKHGRGIGRYMVEYCIDYAKGQGCRALRLDVVPGNTPAKKLYERCGFRYMGDADLERGIAEIPLFSMYEKNLTPD